MYVVDYKINNNLYCVRDLLLKEYTNYLELSFVNITKHKLDLATKAISCILLNVNLNMSRSKVYITLDRSSYSKGYILNGQYTKRKVSYKYTRSVLDFLVNNGYIELHTGGFSSAKENWGFVNGKWQVVEFKQSYFTILDKLKVMIPEFTPDKVSNILRLKDKDKNLLSFTLPHHLRPTLQFQKEYNNFSFLHNITADDIKYYVQAYKVFNLNFKRGGRSFMEGDKTVQSLTKTQRSKIKINGVGCMCFDYHAFEPTLLYTMSQEVYEGNDYYHVNLDGYSAGVMRKICKGFILRMINCVSRASAISACRAFIKDEFNVQYLYDKGEIPEPRIDVNTIIDLLEQKHYLVKDKFYCSYGGELQYAGSLITDYILDYFMQRGVLVIQVHDAYIVTREHEDALGECMKRAFIDILGFDDNVKITQEF